MRRWIIDVDDLRYLLSTITNREAESMTDEELRKRNEPMKIIQSDIDQCPNCGERLFDDVEQTYCDVCGQKLDWSDAI